jgi:hypothetical protein
MALLARPMVEELNGRWLPAVMAGAAPVAEVALLSEEQPAEVDATICEITTFEGEVSGEFTEWKEDFFTTTEWQFDTAVDENGGPYLYAMNTIGDLDDPWLEPNDYLSDFEGEWDGEYVGPAICTISPELWRGNEGESFNVDDPLIEDYILADYYCQDYPTMYYLASSTSVVAEQDFSSAQLVDGLLPVGETPVSGTETELRMEVATLPTVVTPVAAASETNNIVIHADTNTVATGFKSIEDERLNISLI